MKKINLILYLMVVVFFGANKSFAVSNTGTATVYKITMTYLELCADGSSSSTCSDPLVVGSGDSGAIDIAAVTAGVAAASYGDFTTVPFGKSYTYYQVTMKRAITIAGSVSDGSNTCYTKADDSTIATAEAGKTSGSAAEITLYMALTTGSLGDDINSVSASDGSGTSQDAGTVDNDDEYFEYRGAFSQAIKLEPGKLPTLKLAFGTSGALGYVGASGGCTTTGAEQQGLYGAKPDVTATVIY
jgi:hypothetical protein